MQKRIFVCANVETNKNTSLQIYQSQVNVLEEFHSSKKKVFKETTGTIIKSSYKLFCDNTRVGDCFPETEKSVQSYIS